MKNILLCLSLNFIVLIGQSQELENIITKYAINNQFNGSILVHKNDSIIYSNSFGYSNREFEILNQDSTRFKIASVSKLFTAVIIMQLYENNKLQLSDYISKYLPNYKGEGANKVTIQQLLNATSGIDDFEKDGDIVYEKHFSTDYLLEHYCSGKLIHKPGKVFNYNNADFVILGKIIEEITRQSFSQVLNEQILQPLGLKNTGMLNYEVVEGLADSYMYNDSTGIIERDTPYFPENYFSAGGMYSTVYDLMEFSNAIFTGTLLLQETLDILLTPEQESYASGLWVFNFWITDDNQPKVAFRPGNIWGTVAVFIRFLDSDLSIIVLSNMMPDAFDLRDFQYNLVKELSE
jgi:CubicO group peptidase (beta-lactamase class C family)